MVWLIIIGVLALAVGPIFYLLPSAQDRYLAGLRLQARQLGFSLHLRPLMLLDPTAEERVTASGRKLKPMFDCMCYEWLVRQPLHNPPDILLQRLPQAPTVPIHECAPGWGFAKQGERSERDLASWALLSQQTTFQNTLLATIRNLPKSVVAVALHGTAVGVYWRENAAAQSDLQTNDRVQVAGMQLQQLRDQIAALCTELVSIFGTVTDSTKS